MMIDDECMKMRRRHPEVWAAAFGASFALKSDTLLMQENGELAADVAYRACKALELGLDER